jgi:hypothetical protein
VRVTRSILPALALSVASVALSLAALEGIARALGRAPFTRAEQTSLDQAVPTPSWTQFDRELGWVHRPNSAFEQSTGAVSFWADSTRATRPVEQAGAPTYVALVGCSLTEGPGLADNETLGWLLQQRLPLLDVRSYATGGYGSYQSLLSLRRHFARAEKPTSVVIYALGSFHGMRDRASRTWESALRPRGQLVAFIPPHADVNRQGALAEFPGRYVESWRISQFSALAHMVQQAYVTQFLAAADDTAKEFETQVAAIHTMHDLSRRNGALFLVAMIYATDEFKRDMVRQLDRRRIEYADCSPETLPSGHPDALWTYRHAACIRGAVARLAVKGQT